LTIRGERRDAGIVFGVALAARLAVVAWAASSIPPSADGAYYHKVATRIAEGQGYTWLWPDGAVTYAAHYPVGYPALVALGYAVLGAKPVVAMVINAVIGAAAALAVWSLVSLRPYRGSSRLGLFAGLAVALHPVLVPYTAAIMTEGVTAALLVIAAAAADRARNASSPYRAWLGVGLLLGVATLVRPQTLALAPIFGFFSAAKPVKPKRGALAAIVVTATVLAVCAPWTARNCVRMDKCALVSVNGGWNLAIGTQTENGGWHEIVVPEACKEVFQEAAKDECFGREARKVIAENPIGWLRRAPAKLRATFDYFGAAPWYLHTANASRFPYGAKVGLGALETLVSRLLLAAALVTIFRWPSPDDRLRLARRVLAGIGLVASVLVPGAIAYLALAASIAALGFERLSRAEAVVPLTGAVIVATAATHAVFFGAGRYGIVVVPFVTALAFVRNRQ
jgi:4-amino-4-deoxy-L-arabinose transferase-like glycosyltransferase